LTVAAERSEPTFGVERHRLGLADDLQIVPLTRLLDERR
jgi:hypothetical protein